MQLSQAIPLAACLALFAGCADQGPSNIPPTAVFTVACDAFTCHLSDGSTDADGTIEAHAWDFGDGASSLEPNPVHTYAAPGGQFTVTLTVTDDEGDKDTAAQAVAVPRNRAPLADFLIQCTEFTCTFTDRSVDPDSGGSVVTRTWDFGDGQTSSEQSPAHTYAAPGGRFTVTLVVTDDSGARATAAKPIDVGKDRTGTYERETPHSSTSHHSRFVIRSDGSFEFHDVWQGGFQVNSGSWQYACCSGRWATTEPHSLIIFDFAGVFGDDACGEAYGLFLLDGHMAVSYCSAAVRAGFEEGVYSSDPLPPSPGPPPPQAGQIAFVRNGGIYQVNTDGSALVQLTAGPQDSDPAWSPNGDRIAFTRTSGDTMAIFIMDADGSNVVRRATSGSEPTWSPDGAWIAFMCRREQEQGICEVRADSGGTTPDTIYHAPGQTRDPAWSPDGTLIAFMSDWAAYDFLFDIWVVAPDGSSRTALTIHTPAAPNPLQSYQPAWSPDGQWIAFVSCPWAFFYCSSSAVSVMRADGSGVVRVVAASGLARPTWSPDGQLIAYASANVIEWVSADRSQRGTIIADGHSPAWRP